MSFNLKSPNNVYTNLHRNQKIRVYRVSCIVCIVTNFKLKRDHYTMLYYKTISKILIRIPR